MRDASLIPGVEISTEKEDRVCYSFDSSNSEAVLPNAVAWPVNTDQLIKIIKFAGANNHPIIARGAGTGMAGASVPVTNSIVISFEKMRKLLDVDTRNMTVTVEPGIINGKLQKELEYLGFFYPPD